MRCRWVILPFGAPWSRPLAVSFVPERPRVLHGLYMTQLVLQARELPRALTEVSPVADHASVAV